MLNQSPLTNYSSIKVFDLLTVLAKLTTSSEMKRKQSYANLRNTINMGRKELKEKNKAPVILKTGRFDTKDSPVIISSASKGFTFALACLQCNW